MLRLDKINVNVGKVIQSRISLGEMSAPPQQYPVAMMEVNPGQNLGITIKRLAKDIISLLEVDVPNLKEGDLAEKIQAIVDTALPKGFAQNPILRTLEVPGETFAGGDQQGNMAIISVGCTYKSVGIGNLVLDK